MSYIDWLRAEKPDRIGVVIGGDASETARRTTEYTDHPIIMVTERQGATTLAAAMSTRMGPKIDLRLSRGLANDLAAIPVGANGGFAFVHAALFRRELVNQATRVASGMRALANYAAPPEVIEATVLSYLSQLFERHTERRATTLIVHDDAGVLPAATLSRYLTFAAGQPVPMDVGAVPGTLSDGETVEPQAIALHAEFLARSDLDTLIRMHDFLRNYDAGPIFTHWREAFRRAANQPGYELFVQLGLEKLDTVQRRLAE